MSTERDERDGLFYGGFTVPGINLAVGGSPPLAFTLASLIGIVGTAYFVIFGKEFKAYA